MSKIVSALKRWTKVDQLEEIKLLNRYGARNIDELWVMICMGRTAPEVGYWNTHVKTLPARVFQFVAKGRQRKRNRKSQDRDARYRYITEIKAARYQRYVASWVPTSTGWQTKPKSVSPN